MNHSWTGIGARTTPQEILDLMTEIALYISEYDWTLRSGGADGADTAFEMGSTNKEIYLPWQAFNNRRSDLFLFGKNVNSGVAQSYAEKVWETRYNEGQVKVPWDSLKEITKKFMIRNIFQLFGQQMNDISKLIFCWTQDGLASGGTGMAIRTAELFNEAQYRKIEKVKEPIKTLVTADGALGMAHMTILNLQNANTRATVRNMLKTNMDPILLWNPNYNVKKGN